MLVPNKDSTKTEKKKPLELKGYGEEEPKFTKEKERKINEMVKNNKGKNKETVN